MLALVTWAAACLGGQVLRLLRLADEDTPGRLLYATACGYLVMAYGLAAVGLAGRLSPASAGAVVASAALVGLPQSKHTFGRIVALCRRMVATLTEPGDRLVLLTALVVVGFIACVALFVVGMGSGGVIAAGLLLLALAGLAVWRPRAGIAWLLLTWALVTLLAALSPPAGNDYDGLAEHLAQAKIYARTGHYSVLWYDHHSHFPATTQMLFTLGLLFQGPALAKLLHWSFGLIGLGTAYTLGQHYIGRGVGKWAALAYAGTPVIGWLMQVAYVDLSTTAFGMLTACAFMHWRQHRRLGAAALTGLMAGGAMATKMQGIPLFGVVLAGMLVSSLAARRGRRVALSAALVYALAGAVVASPWYIKSWVVTGNPVYPFAYEVFGGRNWSARQARDYEHEQKRFGPGELPSSRDYWALPAGRRRFIGPRTPARLLLAPWNISTNPLPFTVLWRQGPKMAPLAMMQFWIGPGYLLALLALVAMRLWARVQAPEGSLAEGLRGGEQTVNALLWLFLPLWLWWLVSMQLSRYLAPSVVLLAPVVGYTLHRAERSLLRAVPALWLAACLAMASYLACPAVATATGVIPREQYLSLLCQVYDASMAVNRAAPPDGKVILFGEPRGYYIDRDYLWGDPGHHRLIPYDTLTTPRALVTHFREMGITHVLLNAGQIGGWDDETPGPLGLLHRAVAQGQATMVHDQKSARDGYAIVDIRARALR